MLCDVHACVPLCDSLCTHHHCFVSQSLSLHHSTSFWWTTSLLKHSSCTKQETPPAWSCLFWSAAAPSASGLLGQPCSTAKEQCPRPRLRGNKQLTLLRGLPNWTWRTLSSDYAGLDSILKWLNMWMTPDDGSADWCCIYQRILGRIWTCDPGFTPNLRRFTQDLRIRYARFSQQLHSS